MEHQESLPAPPEPSQASGGSFRRSAGVPPMQRQALAPLSINQNINLNAKMKQKVAVHPLTSSSSFSRSIPLPPPVEEGALKAKCASITSGPLVPLTSQATLSSVDTVGTLAADAPPPPAPRPAHNTAPRLINDESELTHDTVQPPSTRAPQNTREDSNGRTSPDEDPLPITSTRPTGGIINATKALNRYLFVKNFVVKPKTPTSVDRRLERLLKERNESEKVNINSAPFVRGRSTVLQPLQGGQEGKEMAFSSPSRPAVLSGSHRAARRCNKNCNSSSIKKRQRAMNVSTNSHSTRCDDASSSPRFETLDESPTRVLGRKNSTARRIEDFDFEQSDTSSVLSSSPVHRDDTLLTTPERPIDATHSPSSSNELQNTLGHFSKPTSPLEFSAPTYGRRIVHHPASDESPQHSPEGLANTNGSSSNRSASTNQSLSVCGPPSVTAIHSPKGCTVTTSSAVCTSVSYGVHEKLHELGLNASYATSVESPEQEPDRAMFSFGLNEMPAAAAGSTVVRSLLEDISHFAAEDESCAAIGMVGMRPSNASSPFVRPATSFGRRRIGQSTNEEDISRQRRSSHGSLTSSDADEPFCSPPFGTESDSGHREDGIQKEENSDYENDFEEASPSVGLQLYSADGGSEGIRRHSDDSARRSTGAVGRDELLGSSSTNSATDNLLNTNAQNFDALKPQNFSLPLIAPSQNKAVSNSSQRASAVFAPPLKPTTSTASFLPSLVPVKVDTTTHTVTRDKTSLALTPAPGITSISGPSTILGHRRKSYGTKSTVTNPPYVIALSCTTPAALTSIKSEEHRTDPADLLLAQARSEKEAAHRQSIANFQMDIVGAFTKGDNFSVFLDTLLDQQATTLLKKHRHECNRLVAAMFYQKCDLISLEMQSRQQRAHIEIQRDLFLYHTVETFIAVARLIDFDDREEDEEGTLWARLVNSEVTQKRQAQERAHRRRARSYKLGAAGNGITDSHHIFDVEADSNRAKFREAMHMRRNEGLTGSSLLPTLKTTAPLPEEAAGGAPYLPYELTQLHNIAKSQIASLRQKQQFQADNKGASKSDIDANTQRMKSLMGMYSGI